MNKVKLRDAMAMDSSPDHRRPRLLEGLEGTQEEEETRDWAELPRDTLLAVLHRMDLIDVLMGAGQVCRLWRRTARGEPEQWRRVDMRPYAKLATRVDLRALARVAVSSAAGRCEAFWAEGVADDKFLSFLAHATPTLKSLRLISCYSLSILVIHKAISKFPLLEELELSLCCRSGAIGIDDIADACPNLTSFWLNRSRFRYIWGVIDIEAMEIARMRELRTLQLFGNSLGNAGLTAILDSCPHLESLDIRHCFNLRMDDDDMRTRCARIKTLRLPRDSMEDYELQYESPEIHCSCSHCRRCPNYY
ncbi:hypothetical protein ACP4OV_027067 [Aristida adscensionis]